MNLYPAQDKTRDVLKDVLCERIAQLELIQIAAVAVAMVECLDRKAGRS